MENKGRTKKVQSYIPRPVWDYLDEHRDDYITEWERSIPKFKLSDSALVARAMTKYWKIKRKETDEDDIK